MQPQGWKSWYHLFHLRWSSIVVVAIVIATTPFFTRSSKWMVYYLVSSSWLLIKLVFRLAPATTADDWGGSRRRHLVNLAEAFGRKIVNLFKLRISHTNSTTSVVFGSNTTNTTAPAPYVYNLLYILVQWLMMAVLQERDKQENGFSTFINF